MNIGQTASTIPLYRRIAGLFIAYFKIAGFTIGGGMVMLPLMEDEFVRKRQWITPEEFLDVVTLVNALPGVIAVNSSLLIGRKVAGWPGGLAACLGAITPSILTILFLVPLVNLIRNFPAVTAGFTAIRSAVAGLILLLIIRQGAKLEAGVREWVFAVLVLLAVRLAGLHPILAIPIAGLGGILVYYREEKEADLFQRGSL